MRDAAHHKLLGERKLAPSEYVDIVVALGEIPEHEMWKDKEEHEPFMDGLCLISMNDNVISGKNKPYIFE